MVNSGWRRLIQRYVGLQDGFSADPAEHTAYFTRALLIPSTILIFLHLVLRRFSAGPEWMASDSLLTALLLWCIIGLFLLRGPYATIVSRVTVLLAWLVAAINCWLGQGVRDAALLLMPAAFMFSGLIAGTTLTLVLTALTVAVIWLLAVVEYFHLHQFIPSQTLDNGRDASIIVIVMAITIVLYGRGLRLSRARILSELAERKRAEAEREKMLVREQEARETAESANLAKDRFIATLSHELRTPLTPVVMSLSAMEADPTLSRELQHEASVMRQNLEIELRLINDLLDMSRARFGKLSMVRRPCHLNAILRDVVNICAPDLTAAQIHLECDLTPMNPEISGDADRLRQVYWNLLRNAIKFTPQAGRITIRSAVQGTPDEPSVRVEITDTGCGIDSLLMPRLFRLFEQGETPTGRRAGGLGIGLAIAQTIIKEHGGQIRASSAGRNQGSTFITDMPCAVRPAEQSTHEQSDNDPPQSSLRILMVEDDMLTALTFDRILRSLGHQPVHAASLAAARKAMEKSEFDLLVSDIGLPDGTGLEVMPLFSQRCRRPGIALSGYGTEEDIERSLAAGFFTHLVKPVGLPQLTRTLNAAAALNAERNVVIPKPAISDSIDVASSN